MKILQALTFPLFVYIWSLGWILSRHFPYLPASYDSAYYLVIAKSFATFDFYRDFSTPDPNVGTLLGPSFYPLLLSLYWRFLHPNLLALQLLTSAVMALAPVMAFLWLRLWLTFAQAFLISLAFGSSYMFIVLGNSFMTEIIFTPILYAGMWLTHRSLQDTVINTLHKGKSDSPEYRETGLKNSALFAMVLWVMLARTRVVGWAFFFVFSGLAAKRRRWNLLSVGLALAGAWVTLERVLARGVHVTNYTDGEFTKTYPVLVDPLRGLKIWGAEAWHSIYSFATSIDAHVLFPYLYGLTAMTRTKRLLCFAVFVWSVWGAWLAWHRWKPMRPWLVATFLASLPTFLIFTSNDSFRYHVPYFPFFALFFVTPLLWLWEASNSFWKKSLPLFACVLIAACQSLHAISHDFETEFMTLPKEFSAIHDSILTAPKQPDICLSPNNYYTYLKTGLPSLHLQARHELNYVRELSRGKEVWAICGPTNDFLCVEWERRGVIFAKPPLYHSGDWRLHRIEAWPESTGKK